MTDAHRGLAATWYRMPQFVRATLLLLLIWTVPVLVGSSGHFFGMAVENGGLTMPASHIWTHSMATWYVWVPATPLILWLARRYRFAEGQKLESTLVHLTAATVVFLVQSVLIVEVGLYTGHYMAGMGWVRWLTDLFVNNYLFTLLTYGIILSLDTGFRLARESRARERTALQLEAQLAQARLEALRSQLQPHFLFNALNSAVMLVRQGSNPEATSVLVQISDLLRYVLDERTPLVTLGDELHFLHRYLGIEQVRFGERLVVEVDVPDELLGIQVPNLILQPIVENALRHGVGARAGVGHLIIRARKVGPMVQLEVEDDGPGFKTGWSLERNAGVGLSSTTRRLQQLYGTGSSLEFGAGSSGGVRVVLAIPAQGNTASESASRLADLATQV